MLKNKYFYYSYLVIVFLCFFPSEKAWSYPDFIGYGYSNCITCHYNSHGNGPLTDYGRALFSQEIAARNFWTPSKITDEIIAEKRSGFVPGQNIPWWIRPSLKYRGLWFQTNPGSEQKVTKTIQMQRDVNLALHFDRDSKTVLVVNYGLLPEEEDYYDNGKKISAVSREHYLRFYLGEQFLVSLGLMDKVYGLRTSDHTAVNRSAIGVGQDDQVHGLLIQWMKEKWDLSLHVFGDNMQKESEDRKPGASMQFEYSNGEKNRIGTSFLYEKNKEIETQLLALHNRWGFPQSPSSILFEMGVKQDKVTGEKSTLGNYTLLQSLIHLRRGYNFLTTIERSQRESKFASPEIQRWTMGFLFFPLQRTEMRVTAVQYKNYAPASVSKDQWQLQGQLHVSW